MCFRIHLIDHITVIDNSSSSENLLFSIDVFRRSISYREYFTSTQGIRIRSIPVHIGSSIRKRVSMDSFLSYIICNPLGDLTRRLREVTSLAHFLSEIGRLDIDRSYRKTHHPKNSD